MAFIKFTKTRSRIDTPKASIWSRGQIGINHSAVVEYGIDSFRYAVLYYDEESNLIGIEFTENKNAEGAVKLVFRKSSGISFSARAFLKTFKIDYSETRRYEFEYDKANKLYVINLNKSL